MRVGANGLTRVFLGLMSMEGDPLGHLVRGVQMLRSYGQESDVIGYSDVIDATAHNDGTQLLCCVLTCESETTLKDLHGICREAEWALGDEPRTLSVSILQYGQQLLPNIPEPLRALMEGSGPEGPPPRLLAKEFQRICGWGQVSPGPEDGVTGEWPSATGR